MKEKLQAIADQARAEISAAKTQDALKQVQIRYLGKKGAMTSVLRGMGQLPPEERPLVGSLANKIRDELTALFAERQNELRQRAFSADGQRTP